MAEHLSKPLKYSIIFSILALKKNTNDIRPIVPMNKTIEASFTEDGKNSWNWIWFYFTKSIQLNKIEKLGIPSDPHIANQYYDNFDDFEYDSSPERKSHTSSTFSSTKNYSSRNSLSQTVGPTKKKTNISKPRSSRYNSGSRYMKSDYNESSASKTYGSSYGTRNSYVKRVEYEDLVGIQKTITEESRNNCELNVFSISF